jgi:hypothetical protein
MFNRYTFEPLGMDLESDLASKQQENKMEENMNTRMTEAQNTLDALAIMDEKNIVHIQTADEIGTEESPSTVPLQ